MIRILTQVPAFAPDLNTIYRNTHLFGLATLPLRPEMVVRKWMPAIATGRKRVLTRFLQPPIRDRHSLPAAHRFRALPDGCALSTRRSLRWFCQISDAFEHGFDEATGNLHITDRTTGTVSVANIGR
jgi:hypothetical protein